MRRFLITGVLALAPMVVLAQQKPAEVPDALQKGSMANEQLRRDTLVGVNSILAAKQCESPTGFTPYVTRLLQGNVGERTWQEAWLFDCGNKKLPVRIDFTETGSSGVSWKLSVQ